MAEALRPRLAGLLLRRHRRGRARRARRRLREASDPCPHLAETVETALDVRLDYRTRLLPQMRRVLDGLRPEGIDPQTGAVRAPAVFPDTREGAPRPLPDLNELGPGRSTRRPCRGRRSPDDGRRPCSRNGEQFEDSFITRRRRCPVRRLPSASTATSWWPEERTGPATADGQGADRVVQVAARGGRRGHGEATGEATGEAGILPPRSGSPRGSAAGPGGQATPAPTPPDPPATPATSSRAPQVTVEMDERTSVRVKRQQKELQQALDRGEFDAAALQAAPRRSTSTTSRSPGKATTPRRSRSTCSTTRARGWTTRSGRSTRTR